MRMTERRCHSRGSGNLWLPIDSGSPFVDGDDRKKTLDPRFREGRGVLSLFVDGNDEEDARTIGRGAGMTEKNEKE